MTTSSRSPTQPTSSQSSQINQSNVIVKMNITMFIHTHSNSSTSPSQRIRVQFRSEFHKLAKISEIHTRGYNGENQNNGVQQLNQMLQQRTSLQLNCNGLQKQAERTLAFHFIYHSCQAIPSFSPRKQIHHLQTNQLHHADEQVCLLANEWSSRPQHYLESTSRSSIESSGEPPSKVLRSGV